MFNGIRWGEFSPGVGFVHGTPVYAIESGTVRIVRRNSPHCPDPNNCPQYDNMVLVEDIDGFYTQYGHITPDGPIQEGVSIQIGDCLGFVDNSGVTTGPHVHIGRYEPGDATTWFNRPTCDWVLPVSRGDYQ
ncbi:M23 family metallopeptidase [Bacillus sp. AFS018417]|uniref:M23 family metallopeptidase n=1 Tax=Bacillus sp. AFS018417 TaxID=2033491 RepID=UPI0034E97DE1